MLAVSPIAFSIGGLTVRWYGIMIVLGMAAGIWLAGKLAQKQGYQEDEILNLSLIILPVGVIGARLYYVATHWSQYADNLGGIIQIWNGGLAIHGGLLLAAIALIIYCRKRRLSFLQTADILMPGVLLGQAIGRWGNYFNQELYGSPTDLPWAITIDGVGYHPAFLYESLWNFAMIFVLLKLMQRKHPYGDIFGWYWILYSICRFFLEFIRVDRVDLDLFGLVIPGSSLVSLICIIFGIVWIAVIRKTRPHIELPK